MANVNAEIKMQGNNDAWFTANAAEVFAANIQIFHIDGRYKFTDGTTSLSALPFLGSTDTLVPYTGATQDVDLDNNNINAKGLFAKGTGGNGKLGLKHQSSDSTASGQETVIFAGSDGEPRYKNDGKGVKQFASRTWVNLQGFITDVIAWLGYTPENVANKQTDLTASSTKYPTVNAVNTGLSTKVTSNSAITGATKTKITYDSKGLVTSGADATTADISDSLNKRYVTDSQLTVIGNTSGTNTGDETNSTIITKIGYTPENISNKSSSYTVSSTTTYANTKALVDGLATKLTNYMHQANTFNPANGTIYTFGMYALGVTTLANLTPTTTARGKGASKTGTIKTVILNCYVGNASSASTQTATLYLRNETTSTNYTIGTFSHNKSLVNFILTFTGLNIPITFGDKAASMVQMPTFTTVPTNVWYEIDYLIE